TQGLPIERHNRVEREHYIECAAMNLDEHPAASSGSLIGEANILTPVVRCTARAEHAKRHWNTGINRDSAQAAQVISHTRTFYAGILAGYLEDARVQFSHHADQLAYLIPICESAGDGLPVRCLMVARARSREADRAGGDGAAQLALHSLQIVFICLARKGSLAHHIGTQRRVTYIGSVVYALGRSLHRV